MITSFHALINVRAIKYYKSRKLERCRESLFKDLKRLIRRERGRGGSEESGWW
jgi:hypothetical protein